MENYSKSENENAEQHSDQPEDVVDNTDILDPVIDLGLSHLMLSMLNRKGLEDTIKRSIKNLPFKATDAQITATLFKVLYEYGYADSPIPSDTDQEPTDTFAYVSIADLLDDPDEHTSWLVDELLPTGGLSIVASKPKVGKSTISRQLAVQISAPGENEYYWLGRKVDVSGGVLLLALEEKRAQVREHLMETGVTKEHNLNVIFWAPPTDDPIGKLHSTIQRTKPSLVIIDPMQRMLNLDDGNDYSQTTQALNPYVDLVRATGIHLMLIHHNRKSNEGDRGDQTLGSTGYFASVDTQITMTRDSNNRRFAVSMNRYGRDLEKIVIDESAGKVATFDEVNSHAIEEQILEILTKAQGRVKQKSVNDDCGKPPGFTEIVLKLVKENKVERTGKGVRGNPYYLEV